MLAEYVYCVTHHLVPLSSCLPTEQRSPLLRRRLYLFLFLPPQLLLDTHSLKTILLDLPSISSKVQRKPPAR